jgi:hypothetical protein
MCRHFTNNPESCPLYNSFLFQFENTFHYQYFYLPTNASGNACTPFRLMTLCWPPSARASPKVVFLEKGKTQKYKEIVV